MACPGSPVSIITGRMQYRRKAYRKGGASSDKEVVRFLAENLLQGMDFGFMGNIFGCSTVAVQTPDGKSLFGRNFDRNRCEPLAAVSHSENGYASVSTVNVGLSARGQAAVWQALCLKWMGNCRGC